MNIVFLTSEGTHQYYLINELHKCHPVQKVLLQRPLVPRKSFWKRVKRWMRPASVRAGVRSLLERSLFRHEAELERLFEEPRFFPNRTPELDPAIPFEFVRSFNDSDGVAQVVREEPDIIIVFGTDILRGAILHTARVAMLNIHRSIVPKYRGGGHPFWAFYHGDFNHIGTTVHVCTGQLDGGDIVGQALYSLSPDDRIYTLRYHTTLIALDILKKVIPRLVDRSIEYFKQPSEGKTWRAKDLTIWKQIVARWKFRRQHPIDKYIVDFVTLNGKLILEVDGATHSTEAELQHDMERTRVLESCGFHVIRVSNVDVYDNLEGVLAFIDLALRPRQ